MKITIPATERQSHFSRSVAQTRRLAWAPVLCLALMAGCATKAIPPEQTQVRLEAAIKEADNELTNGQREKAVALLNQAAKEHPTSPAPWLKLANVWFDSANYPSAILAANEVLQRDESNQEAKSVLVVAGLRVAASSVSGLRSGTGVNSNVREEAENLTNSLRGLLGEKALVPPAIVENRTPSTPARTKSRSKAVANGAATAAAAPKNTASIDPFKSLK